MTKNYELCNTCDGTGTEFVVNKFETKFYGHPDNDPDYREVSCRDCNGLRVTEVIEDWELEDIAYQKAELAYCYQ